MLSIEGPESLVAELPVFDDGSYPASVAAVEEARLYFISEPARPRFFWIATAPLGGEALGLQTVDFPGRNRFVSGYRCL